MLSGKFSALAHVEFLPPCVVQSRCSPLEEGTGSGVVRAADKTRLIFTHMFTNTHINTYFYAMFLQMFSHNYTYLHTCFQLCFHMFTHMFTLMLTKTFIFYLSMQYNCQQMVLINTNFSKARLKHNSHTIRLN